MTPLPSYLCLAGLVALLALAALRDLRERRIPNWLTGTAAGLYPIYVLVAPTPVAWLGALGLALVVSIVGLALFARDLIGGGDVKLIAALSLWAGFDHFALFALVTTLTGGAIGLISLWYQRWSSLISAYLAPFGRAAVAGRTTAADAPQAEAAAEAAAPSEPLSITLPYGIAIAAGGVAVVVELIKL